ncbi:glycoside hydrolase family 43 protein [uncultured Draconibacterium sp.]|uniref:glycoside hydrolase family 43 protein n=1 Tax=uncultured Draconibacterium sp. TaxID=1573823 RepID=UPI003260FE9C
MFRRFLIISLLLLVGFENIVNADNPIVSHRYLADPGALVYNGHVYLYCSNDDQNPYEGGYKMSSIVCVSSSDLKNWTDHGKVFQVPQDATWAIKSWAPSPVERNGKFYLYFGNGGNGIGVAIADSPAGPFTDAIDGKLVTSETPGVMPAEHMWLFDPMTFIDDDGQAYMYFGGNGENNMRVIKLNDDMISVDGKATSFKVPYFFEASWMHKYEGKYYFSYSTNPRNGMRIDYMVGDSPVDGFTYGGVVSNQPPDNNNNNHHAIFQLGGNWYQAYHNRVVAKNNGIPTGYRRNLCLDAIFHNEDGSIETMVNTVDGVQQLMHLNPFQRIEAETINEQKGIKTAVNLNGGLHLTAIGNGDWIKVKGVDFGDGAHSFTANVASGLINGEPKGGEIEIRLDEENGAVIGTLVVPYTGGLDVWKKETTVLTETSGIHDVYFKFKGDSAQQLFNFDYWQFEKNPD